MDPATLIFPECGITYGDCLGVSGVSHRTAARKLGIAHSHFHKKMKKLGLSYLYPDVRSRVRCISKEDIIKVAESRVSQKDAAYILGVHYTHLKMRIKEYGIRHHFITTSQAVSVGIKGYCSHNLVQSMR